jgi:hypothetical protein
MLLIALGFLLLACLIFCGFLLVIYVGGVFGDLLNMWDVVGYV